MRPEPLPASFRDRARPASSLSAWWLVPIAVLAAPLSLVAAGSGTLPGDRAITEAIQRHTPALVMEWYVLLNHLGEVVPWTALVTVGLALILAVIRHLAEAMLLLVTLPLRLVNAGLKLLFDSPRPIETDVTITELADGFGFPSGHASGAMLLYGVLYFVAPRVIRSPALRRLLRIAAIMMIVMAGLARIAVGAHWPSDVVGGYLWGGLVLIILIVVFQRLAGRRADVRVAPRR